MAKTNHPVEPEELMAYLDGELPPDRAVSAAAHLERCPECQRLAGDLQGVSRKLMGWQVAPSSTGIAPRVSAALAERTHERPGTRRVQLWAWGFAAAALVLVVGLMSGPRMWKDSAKAQFTARESVDFYGAKPLPARSAASAPSRPMIARTAGLALIAADFDGARASVESILSRHHGYFGDLNVTVPAGAGRTLSATLRVPADQLEAILVELRKLGRVEAESQNAEEVTSQYVDLEARLANARNTAQRLTGLLRERTGKLADVLAVETELDRVRGEIESMEAQRKSLSTRVDFASVNLTLTENYKAQLQPLPDSTWNRLRNAAIQGYRSMADSVVSALLFLISAGPSLVLWGALLFLPARFAWRKWRPTL